MNSALAQYARDYRAAGFFPVRIAANSKRPLDAGWQTARPSAEEAAALFAQHQGNIGITFPRDCFALDIDCKGDIDGRAVLAAYEFDLGPLPPTLTQITPSGGEHRIFRLPEGVALSNKVAVAPGVDIRTTGGQIVVAPSAIDGKPYRWAKPDAPIADIPPRWLDLLRAGVAASATAPPAPPEGDAIPEGARNDTLHKRAATMRRAGFAADEILPALQALNARCCAPPLDEGEVAAIAASAARYQAAPEPWQVFGRAPLPAGALPMPPGPKRAPRVSIADLDTSPPAPQRFLIEGILPGGVLTLLGAHGGAGKSMLALTAAACLVTGRSFMGKVVEKCRVLFFSAEDPAPVVRRRLAKLCRHLGISPQELAAGLMVLDATDAPVLYASGGEAPAFDTLRADAAEFAPGVVIIDNASDVYDANEIERARVREFVRLLASLGKPRNAAVLLLAHVDKATAKDGRNSEGYSGSTAWHNSARSRLFLVNEAGRLTLEHQKSNFGPLSAPIHMAWTPDGLLAQADAPGGADDKASVLRLLTEAYERGVHISPAATSPNNAYRVLSALPAFPPGLTSAGTRALICALETEGAIARVTIKGADRHPKTIFRPTAGSAGSAREVQPPALATNTPAPAGGVCQGVWGSHRTQPDPAFVGAEHVAG